MGDDYPIGFNEVFTIPESLRGTAVHRISHLVNFGQRTALFLEYKGDLKFVVGVIDLLKFYQENVVGNKIWVIYDDVVEFKSVLDYLGSVNNVVMTSVSNIDITNFQERDFVILLLRHGDVSVVSKLLRGIPSVLLVVLRGVDENLSHILASPDVIKLYTYFNTFLIRDDGDVKIYELGVSRLSDLGYTITPLSRISDNSKAKVLVLYDNYTSFVKALIYLLNEIKRGNEPIFITSPNLPLIQKYVHSMRVIRKYNIRFVEYNVFLNNPAHIGSGTLIVEHPFPDLATVKNFYIASKVFDYTILSSNSMSFNSFMKSLLIKSNVDNPATVKQLVNLFNVVVKVHMEYSSMNSLVVECYTKREFSLGKSFVALIKVISRLRANALIKTVNHSAVAEMLESLGWTQDLTSNKKRVILVEPTKELYESVDKQKIIITSDDKKYADLNLPIIIDLDKLL